MFCKGAAANCRTVYDFICDMENTAPDCCLSGTAKIMRHTKPAH